MLGRDTAHTRAAFDKLDRAGLARMFRRGRGGALYLAPADAKLLLCAVPTCRTEFQRGRKSKRQTCSRKCHAIFAWQTPGSRERRSAALKAVGKSPGRVAALFAHNKRRWSDPEQHEKLRRQNSTRWKGRPEAFEEYRARMRILQSTPERKAMYSEMRKAFWRDPVMRKKMRDAATKSLRTQAYRALFSEYLKARWKDPVMREKYTRANAQRNSPELKAKNSKRMKKLWSDPAWRAEQLPKLLAGRKKLQAEQLAARALRPKPPKVPRAIINANISKALQAYHRKRRTSKRRRK